MVVPSEKFLQTRFTTPNHLSLTAYTQMFKAFCSVKNRLDKILTCSSYKINYFYEVFSVFYCDILRNNVAHSFPICCVRFVLGCSNAQLFLVYHCISVKSAPCI